ncbi:unnamed protein product [Amoebophrya sp. A120]|nr:unnamed protein product [Amoebophrya sp. A120]|eukprot:GSA120T00004326001.1
MRQVDEGGPQRLHDHDSGSPPLLDDSVAQQPTNPSVAETSFSNARRPGPVVPLRPRRQKPPASMPLLIGKGIGTALIATLLLRVFFPYPSEVLDFLQLDIIDPESGFPRRWHIRNVHFTVLMRLASPHGSTISGGSMLGTRLAGAESSHLHLDLEERELLGLATETAIFVASGEAKARKDDIDNQHDNKNASTKEILTDTGPKQSELQGSAPSSSTASTSSGAALTPAALQNLNRRAVITSFRRVEGEAENEGKVVPRNNPKMNSKSAHDVHFLNVLVRGFLRVGDDEFQRLKAKRMIREVRNRGTRYFFDNLSTEDRIRFQDGDADFGPKDAAARIGLGGKQEDAALSGDIKPVLEDDELYPSKFHSLSLKKASVESSLFVVLDARFPKQLMRSNNHTDIPDDYDFLKQHRYEYYGSATSGSRPGDANLDTFAWLDHDLNDLVHALHKNPWKQEEN